MARFSIILPVLNGGNYIKGCIQSILSQTVSDFAVHVLDSGSTDGTVQWLSSLTDIRIQLYTSEVPLSIEENWNRIITIPRNEWMTIMGHDDLLHPNYLEEIARLINQHPDAGVIGTHFNFIDGYGNVRSKCLPVLPVMTAELFVEKIIPSDIGVVSMVFRSKEYDKIGGFPAFPNLLFSDFKFYIELVRLSYIVVSPEICLSYRIHSNNTTSSSDYEKYYESFDLYAGYLKELRGEIKYNTIIKKAAVKLLNSRYLEFANKVIYTPARQRVMIRSITDLKRRFRIYARDLIDTERFDSITEFKIKFAEIIDATSPGRYLYLKFKKLQSNLKS